MPSVGRIDIQNSLSRQNVKNVLGYAVKKRSGTYRELRRIDMRKGDTIETFETANFLHIKGNNLNNQTFGITELGDDYYKYVFGKLSYWYKRLSGAWERFKDELYSREK